MDKSLLEVGCGTGQATEPFLKTKCKVTAVELGENLLHIQEKSSRFIKISTLSGPLLKIMIVMIINLICYILLLHSTGYQMKLDIKRHIG